MAHVFVSYHQSTVEQAYALHAALESAGYSTWINPDPQAGENWLPWVQVGLEDAWGVLVLLNDEAVASPFVTYEWAFALGDGHPVLPVYVASCVPHPALDAYDPLDLTDDGLDAVLARLNVLARPFCRVLSQADSMAEPVAAALAAMGSAQPEDRHAAVVALGDAADPVAEQALIAALAHPVYRDVRLWAVDGLRGRIVPDVIAGLVDALGDSDLAVTQAAFRALAELGMAAIPALQEALSSVRRGVRRAAVLTLAAIDDPAVVPVLIEALYVRDWHVSRSAAVALGQRGDPRAIPALAGVLQSDDPHLGAAAEDALLRIGTTEALRLLAQR